MVSLHAALAVMAMSGSGQTMLLDFYADWCGPCRAMDPTVHELAAKGYPVRRVNVDREAALASQFHVTTIPCFVMVVDGREADRMVGGAPLRRLEQMCRMGAAASSSKVPTMIASRPAAPPARPIAAAAPVGLPQSPPAATDAFLIAASVRLRIEDADGHSCGSGTIVDAQPGGEALILTCGHIFRDSEGKGKIEVDLFGPTPASRVPGRLVAYDLRRDVGLVAFQPPGPVAVARVAPPEYALRAGDPVASVGCNNGDLPTVQHSRVTTLNQFLGPPNIEVAGQPIVGRSGGGLFSPEGFVVGVCNAADPSDHEGVFAAMGSIHAQLDQVALSCLYQPQANGSRPGNAWASSAELAPSAAPRVRMPMPSPEPPVAPASGDMAGGAPLATGEQAALEEIRRHVKEGAEVVCIIRDHRDPEAKSQVITLARASPAFVKRLAAEARPSDPPVHETALEIPKPRTPLLEWDAQDGWRHREPIPGVAGTAFLR